MGKRGKVAVITGGGTGIGRETAIALSQQHHQVALVGRRPEVLRETAEVIRGLGHDALDLPCDVRDPDAVAGVIDQVTDRWGTPNVLVNNAGGQFPVDALAISPNGWRAVLDTNLSGTFYFAQAFARALVADAAAGVILNMTIPWVDRGCPGLSHAVAARAGVVALTKSLALEWAPHRIRVNCIAPGLVVTDGMIEEELGGDVDRVTNLLAAVPLGEPLHPADVAAVMAFMVSDAASYMTGQTIFYDGGVSLGRGLDFMPS